MGLAALAFAFAAAAQAKGPIVVLDGIRLGQSLAQVRPHLGKSLQVQQFEDGWRAEAFERDGHYVALETAPGDPDVIVSIQITGDSNAPGHGLDSLDLGDPVADIEALLGEPKEVKDAVDAVAQAPVASTELHSYGDFSFEVSGGRITSIKTQLGGWGKAPDLPDLAAFLATLRSGDPQRIAQVLSSDLELRGEPAWNGPMLDALQSDARVREALFGAQGVVSLPDAADDGALRVWTDDAGRNLAGYVFKFADGPVDELMFMGGPEGWELYEVN
jgi:hypothetical protein